LAVALTAVAARLAVLPFATADGGDASSRTWSAWEWMLDPRPITHGVWGPLHTYLLAAAMALYPDPVRAAVALGLVLSAAAAAALYVFTRIEIGGARGALVTGLTYAIYPVAIRNGVSVRSETPFTLFLLLSMIAVALARREEGTSGQAAAGGLALTAASMLRYEGWALLPLIAALLWRKPRLLAFFVACAAVHPLIWMMGNWLQYRDPLYSMNWASRWELESMGRAGLNDSRLLADALRYPLTVLQGMTAPFALASIAGLGIALAIRHRSRLWILPLAGLTALWSIAIACGTLVPKLNYTESAGALLFPFSALLYKSAGFERWGAGRVALAAAALALSGGLLGLGTAVPRIENQELALQLPPIITESVAAGYPALISDHYGWGATHHVALLTRLRRPQLFFAPGAPNGALEQDSLRSFIAGHPRGVLIARAGSRFSTELGIGPAASWIKLGSTVVKLEKIRSLGWPGRAPDQLFLFRYTAEPGRTL
jgi:hypothetical protein